MNIDKGQVLPERKSAVKIGIINNIRFTEPGGLGNQYTTIDGVLYATWFDLRTTPVRVNCEVEYETGTDPNFRCPTARILRVTRQECYREDAWLLTRLGIS